MDFLPVFTKMVELFLIVIISYVAARFGVINRTVKASLSKIILNISLPCTVLASVATAKEFPSGGQLAKLLIVSFSSYLVLYILAKITGVIMGFKGKQRGVAEFGIMFCNVGFIGYPVTQAIFGNDTLLYTTMFNLPFNILCYSVGVYMIKAGSDKDADGEKPDYFKKMKSLLFTPAMISSLIALFMALIKVKPPVFLGDTFSIVGGMTTPGALIVIGAALAEMPAKDMFTNVKAYIYTFISIIVTPILIFAIYRPFTMDDPLLLGVAVIISAMPVATAGTMLCVEYDGDEKLMAQITFLTTVISVFTIPLLAVLLPG